MTALDNEISQMARAKPWLRSDREPGETPVSPRNPCEMVLTMPHNTNGRILRVRCRCMATYGVHRSYYNYDHIADVTSLEAARGVWDAHRRDNGTHA